MVPHTNEFTNWRKARASDKNGGSCVEVGYAADGRVAVRDTKDRGRPPHVFTREEWLAFLDGAKNGEFDV
ncbi:DUF397 domain-containing protein [Amycolatopsis cihanbeyliensis]|uniref:Uncharacterized protein DUF397 n=1 Tax=Amycolatopsis cihanbeyliensis TaxID=1128664 RepID=A0A542CTS9_AMYCI|nr:DUF397 domain-containing protein [Amycolatopsis cihanbeyliensis]TQI94200.1 uncharacterized protein DUF397 [Amycolatopsis cihanbeyliensis]